jgi:hypothetical protein
MSRRLVTEEQIEGWRYWAGRVSVATLARQDGVSEATIYYHIKSWRAARVRREQWRLFQKRKREADKLRCRVITRRP